MFVLKQFLKDLILPPLPWIFLLLAVFIFWKRPWARKLLLLTIGLILALHSGYVDQLLRRSLESRHPPLIDPRAAGSYDAIVVLTGGLVPAAGAIPFPTINESMFRRLDEAWRLYRIRRTPIVISGGHSNPFTPPRDENRVAVDYLVLWGVPRSDVIAEPDSRDTFESAVRVREILRRKGWKRYLLVTSAIHMPRSMLAFGAIAPEPVAAPGDFAIEDTDFELSGLIPSTGAAKSIFAGVHEYVGLANYYWRARLSAPQ